MDFAQYDQIKERSQEGAKLHLRGPDGDPLYDERKSKGPGDRGPAVTITLRGQDGEAFREASHRVAKQRLARQLTTGQLVPDPKDLEVDALDLLVAATLGWEGVFLEGDYLKFDQANARSLYERFPFVQEQVAGFVNNRRNFMGNSQRGSSATPKQSPEPGSPR